MSLNKILSGSSDRNIGTRSIKAQMKSNFAQLKVVSVLMESIALAACGGSSTGPAASMGALTCIAGTWRNVLLMMMVTIQVTSLRPLRTMVLLPSSERYIWTPLVIITNPISKLTTPAYLHSVVL
jgi:hypothetical protein